MLPVGTDVVVYLAANTVARHLLVGIVKAQPIHVDDLAEG